MRTSQKNSPKWHKGILQRRLAKVVAGKGKFLTLAELKKRLEIGQLSRIRRN
jgi:hypothetical protein